MRGYPFYFCPSVRLLSPPLQPRLEPDRSSLMDAILTGMGIVLGARTVLLNRMARDVHKDRAKNSSGSGSGSGSRVTCMRYEMI